jgi:hypothetical protein
MKRIIRNLFTYATRDQRSRFVSDEILRADPVPKLLLTPTTWRGDLQPVLDAYLEQLRPLENGLTLGRTLSAEEVPAVLNLGVVWLGMFAERMLASRSDAPGAVEATPVLAALEAVRREMAIGDRQRIADGLRQLRQAADSVNAALFGSHCEPEDDRQHGGFSGGRRIADGFMPRHSVGGFSRPVPIATINQRNRDFHARNSPTLDSSGRMLYSHDRASRTADSARTTALRDAEHAVVHASTTGQRIGAMNVLHRLKATRDGEPPGAVAVISMPAPRTPAEINAANRAHWASRG